MTQPRFSGFQAFGFKNEDDRRGSFSFLPVCCATDLEAGAMFWLTAAICATLIPIVLLVNDLFHEYYGTPLFLPSAPLVTWTSHLISLGLLTLMGVFLISASSFFLKAVRLHEARLAHNAKEIHANEVHAIFLMFLGTLCAVPVCAIHVYENGIISFLGLALLLTLIVSICTEVIALGSFPRGNMRADHVECCSPILRGMCACTCCAEHFQSDWLILLWLVFMGSVLAVIFTAGALIYFAMRFNIRAIYDFASSLGVSILILLGTIYCIAGSYETHLNAVDDGVHHAHHHAHLNPSRRSQGSLSNTSNKSQRNNSDRQLREPAVQTRLSSTGDSVGGASKLPFGQQKPQPMTIGRAGVDDNLQPPVDPEIGGGSGVASSTGSAPPPRLTRKLSVSLGKKGSNAAVAKVDVGGAGGVSSSDNPVADPTSATRARPKLAVSLNRTPLQRADGTGAKQTPQTNQSDML